MKEKKLSEKRTKLLTEWLHPIKDVCEREALIQVFQDIKEQDKEVVEKLKEELSGWDLQRGMTDYKCHKIIDKIFGEFK